MLRTLKTNVVTSFVLGAAAMRPFLVARQDDEAGDVVFGVLDVLGHDVETIEIGRKPRRKRRHRAVPGLLDELGGTCRVAGDHRLPAVGAHDLAALAERMDMAVNRADFILASRPAAPSAGSGSA